MGPPLLSLAMETETTWSEFSYGGEAVVEQMLDTLL